MHLPRQQFALQRGERGRDEARGKRRDRSNAEHRKHAGADRGCALADVLEPEQKPLDLGVEQNALRRRADARTVPGKQEIADFGLKILDLPRDNRLRTAEQPRRAGDAAGRHHGRKGLEKPDIDDVVVHGCVVLLFSF